MGVSLAQLLVRSARAWPDQPALAIGEFVTATYAQLGARVCALAGGMQSHLDLAACDRVALVMRNCPQYVEALFACWHAGLAAVPINAKLHSKELEFILEDSGARACFVTAEHGGDVGSLDEEGFLTLRDRSKDVIISGGSNIYPREVEEMLLRHPVVSEVSVIGEPDRE